MKLTTVQLIPKRIDLEYILNRLNLIGSYLPNLNFGVRKKFLKNAQKDDFMFLTILIGIIQMEFLSEMIVTKANFFYLFLNEHFKMFK